MDGLKIIESLLTGAGSATPILLITWVYLHFFKKSLDELKKDFTSFKNKVDADREECIKIHTRVEIFCKRVKVLEQG